MYRNAFCIMLSFAAVMLLVAGCGDEGEPTFPDSHVTADGGGSTPTPDVEEPFTPKPKFGEPCDPEVGCRDYSDNCLPKIGYCTRSCRYGKREYPGSGAICKPEAAAIEKEVLLFIHRRETDSPGGVDHFYECPPLLVKSTKPTTYSQHSSWDFTVYHCVAP